MRKLIIIFLAVSLFAACKNDKKVSRDDRRTETDDYRNKDEDNKDAKDRDDNKTTDYKDDRDSRDNAESNWTSNDVKVFVDNCSDEAERKGMQRSKAESYCNCMQQKLEVMYPNTADVANLNVESPSVKAMIEKCLE